MEDVVGDTTIGTIGERLTDSFAGTPKIVTGWTDDCIVKTMNLSLLQLKVGSVVITLVLLENVPVLMEWSGMIMKWNAELITSLELTFYS